MAGNALSLAFHVLNVGHGSSVVVEFDSESGKAFGVIDSNCDHGAQPKALRVLQGLGADRLAFVCLTHPHADHFRGLSEVLRSYTGRIDHFYSFPLGSVIHNTKRLKKWGTALDAVRKRTDDEVIKFAAQEFS